MQQLVMKRAGELGWQEVAPPTLNSPQAAIVRPIAVGVCDFDRALVQGRIHLPGPVALGHEIVAEVIETGADVASVSVGMQVVLPLHISCGTCGECGHGRTNCCSSRPLLANYGLGPAGGDWGGGMSDRLLVPFADGMLVPVPAGVSAIDCAAVGCNLVDTYRTIAPFLANYDRPSVLVLSGVAINMSLYAIAAAKALGVEDLILASDTPQHRAWAEQMGARALAYADLGDRSFSILSDNSGSPAMLTEGLKHVAPGGVCTTTTPYFQGFEMPVHTLFAKNITYFTGQPHARALMDQVLERIDKGLIGTTRIPHEVLPWERALEAFGRGEKKRIFVRS
ncbi:alcohol dehydrogenase catalytic domain-containing protein [Cupriavidus basilensis]|uniref:Alcohol dehydrogenase catalytic domain-containing protein n=1 Tax=Cupriavidus basilensis TaxID=68895 RepID=A0ABT6AJH3_9BURK|nr:alcohol dehydrogenase catalytic domain-containing protein [Cupriavidus basilensis]MDF3832742.1 alcohol dehydrogenase catalytic domain-containing protein [Cupriavidus basilensis]